MPYAEITQVYVQPDARRSGVAQALMTFAEAQAARFGATSVHLVTGVDNLGAQAFYKAAGYEDLYVGFDKFLPAAYQVSALLNAGPSADPYLLRARPRQRHRPAQRRRAYRWTDGMVVHSRRVRCARMAHG